MNRRAPCLLMAAAGLAAILTGCQSPQYQNPPLKTGESTTNRSDAITLKEGDVLRVAFPGAPDLDVRSQPQPVRRDGYITLPLVNEVKAAGLTPAQLEKELLKLYSDQLVSKSISVTIVSSSYTVYVSGSVLRPGKIISDHPMSVLEAIMEAGGFDNTKADLKGVKVIRQESGQPKNFTVNLKEMIDGKAQPFILKPGDIIYVPERFTWF